MPDRIRLGIIGTGWGSLHARVAAELDSVLEVRAVCARRRNRLEALVAELGLPNAAVEESWEDLICRDDVDLVVNTAPDYLHAPITLAAIDRGKHVFCEKPLAMNVAQAQAMCDAAERAGVCHFSGFVWRFAAPFATVRRLIDDGALGALRFLDGHFCIGPPRAEKAWQLEASQRAHGVLGNLGVHLVDLARFLVGRPGAPLEPSAGEWKIWARLERSERHDEREWRTGPDIAWVHFQMGASVAAPTVTLRVSQVETLRTTEALRLELHGTRATAICQASPLAPDRQQVSLLRQATDPPYVVAPLDYPGGYPRHAIGGIASGGLLLPALRHLYEAHVVPQVRTGKRHLLTPTFHDGLVAQRVLDAAAIASQTRAWAPV